MEQFCYLQTEIRICKILCLCVITILRGLLRSKKEKHMTFAIIFADSITKETECYSPKASNENGTDPTES